ncbi:hypothetical protein [Paenibacillus sp. Soil522]|uniref:hypothetical protein n=1 Tax=Paenibacillus sp. Soil522 TaxID=1736388 RepID=UPI0006F9F98E|nr:hypothetical protein [Paenibacillus sp. Soil522]KRE44463.1 hypothetical protein ASG81_15145 [Paenibacillus sp. Soil522]
MRHSIRKTSIFISLLMVLVVMLSAVPSSFAAATAEAAVNKKVYITKASYVQLIDANLIPSSSGATASFTFTFYNGDSKDLILNDYWARLRSVGGTKYTLTLLDQTKKKIAPKSSATLTFYSQVGSKASLDQLVINIIKFDFSVSGYERTVAKYTFPKGYSNFVKAGGFKTILVNNSNVNVRIDQINVRKKDKNYEFNLSYVVRNTSRFGVTLPQYNYYVQTSAGLYKLSLKNKTDETLLLEPTVLNAVRLTGSIPSTLAITGWKLIITDNAGAEANKVELPVVTLDIPFKLTTTPAGSSVTTFTNESGTYEVTLKSVQRLPWTTKDRVIAEMVIRNKESVFVPLPDLTGQFVIDENIKLDSKIVAGTEVIGLAPGGSATVHFIGEIPFSYSWRKFSLQLSEKTGEQTNLLADLTKSSIAAVPTVKAGSVYTQSVAGSQLTAQVTDVRTYKGEDSDIYAVYVEVTNKQNRSNFLPAWAGYFKTADGNYYEVKMVKANNVIKPSNKEQIILYADLPVNANKEGIQLLIGEAYDDSGVIMGTGTAKGYIRPIQLELPAEKTDISSFKQMKAGPYTVDMTYFNAFMDGYLLDIDMGATLVKDRMYDGFTQNKLTMVLEKERTNEVILTHTIDLEGKSDGGTTWKVGENYSELTKDMTTTPVWDDYTLNIYETFEGHKIKLASVDISWSTYINWLDGTH